MNVPFSLPESAAAEVERLVEVLRATDEQLETLLGGNVDTVLDRLGHPLVLRRALGQLRRSDQEREGTILDALPANVALLDARGTILAVNEGWRQFAVANGLATPAHAVGTNYLEVCDAIDDADAGEAGSAAAGIRAVLAGAVREWSCEYACHSPAEQRWFCLTVVPMLDGPQFGAVVMHTSVTVRRQADRRLAVLTAAMPLMLWVAGTAGRMTFFNAHWLEYTGLDHETSVGGGWMRCLHEDDHPRWTACWEEAMRTGAPCVSEVLLRRADGAYRWWLVRVVSLPPEEGDEPRWMGTCTDIHELKTAQQDVVRANVELQKERSELRVLFDVVPAGVIFKDTMNRFIRVNERAAAIFGCSVAEMEGNTATELLPAAAASAYAEDVEILLTGTPLLTQVQPFRKITGQKIWVEKEKVPYRDGNGQIIGILVVLRDVTERARDREALRELNADLEGRVLERTRELNVARNEAEGANRAKSEFLATMSHEIRTPLAGLLGMLELLSISRLDPEQNATLNVARDSGMALEDIIDDILDFSKIEANRLDLLLVAASVEEVVEQACRLHSQNASRKGLSLRVQVDPAISRRLSFDPLRLGQILNNFINNAIKFTDNGTIDVAVALEGRGNETENLCFTVRDSGIGMTPDQLHRVFAPFVQGSAETQARFGGTGLGLVISRRLAELMGGTVSMASVSGEGTTLTLRLAFDVCAVDAEPMSSGASRAELLDAVIGGRRAVPAVAAAEAERTLLLVADDHPTNRMVLLRQLASLGYAAEAASDGEEALAAFRSGRFAAVITDCNMPRMNGYELARAIRALEADTRAAPVPVIAYTANTLPAAVELCLAAGMDDCMIKPADLGEVSRKMDRWLPLLRHTPEDAPLPLPAGGRVAGDAEGLLDVKLIAEIAGGNVAAQLAILADFRRVNEADAAALRSAVRDGNHAGIGEASHRMRGSTLMLGATLLGHACEAIGVAAASCDPLRIDTGLAAFEVELLRLYRFLDDYSPTASPAG